MDFSALNPRTSNLVNLAARNNDVRELKRLLKAGKNPNCNDNRGWCAIHEAAANDSYDALEILLDHPDVLPLQETFEGQTALFLACRYCRSLKVVRLLLERAPALVARASNERVSPLHVACAHGRLDAAQALLGAGAPLDAQDFDGDTPLHEAARNGHARVAAALLHAGADAAARNSYGLTPFLLACCKATIDCVEALLPFVGDIDECANDGNTALILAAQRGALDIARFLLGNEANPDLANEEGMLPLYLALINGHPKVFQLLLPVTAIDEVDRSIVNCACKPLYFSMDILIALLESDLYPEFFNECDAFHVVLERVLGFRPRYRVNPPLCSVLNVIEYIHRASPELCETLLLLFLSKGVAVNPLYACECPPLVYLHYCDHVNCFPQVIEILVSQGCDIDYSTMPTSSEFLVPDAIIASITSNGHTLPLLLTYSLKVDPEEIVSKLLEYDMIGQRVSLEILKKILPNCCLSVSISDKLRKHLEPYLALASAECTVEYDNLLRPCAPSLKHLCRRTIRRRLRKNVLSTQDFFNVLRKLPLPVTMRDYLRFAQ